MFEWLKGLDEASRALLVGVVVQYIVQALKWLGDKAGLNVAEAKLSKLVTAGVTAAAATLLVTGYSAVFWREWLFAFASAVLLHEAGNKAARKVTQSVANAAFSAFSLVLVGVVICCCLYAPPAHADNWQDRLGAAVILAPNDGNFFGASLSYQLHDSLWLEFAVRRDAGGTAEGAGLSTDAQVIADLLERVVGFDLPAIPERARVGATVVGDKFAYIAYDLGF